MVEMIRLEHRSGTKRSVAGFRFLVDQIPKSVELMQPNFILIRFTQFSLDHARATAAELANEIQPLVGKVAFTKIDFQLIHR